MAHISEKRGSSGKTTYQAKVRCYGQQATLSFPTREEAETWAKTKEEEFRTAATKKTETIYTVADVLDEYRTYYPAAPHELETDVAPFAELPITGVTAELVATVWPDDGPLMDAFEQAIEHARRFMGVVIAENPVSAYRVQLDSLPYRPLTEWEEEQILLRGETLAKDSLSDVLILALDTALEQQEVLELRTSQVDLANSVIRMSEHRIIPLTPRAKAVLCKRVKPNQDHIFQGLTKNTVQAAFLRLKESLGINGPDFNGIRRIAIAKLAVGRTAHELKALTGHVKYDSLDWIIERMNRISR